MGEKAPMTPGVALSVVVPAHDEAANLARLVAEVRSALDAEALAWELIVVDDGSTDETPALLARLAAAEPRLRSLRLERRSGQTAALAAGFRAARGTLIATLDADLQCPPAELPALLRALDGAGMASGIRSGRHDPPSRRVASALANFARRCFLAPGVRDLACPIRVFRADALARVTERFALFDGAHRWLPALFHLGGERIVQRPVAHRPREAGVSKYTTRGRLLPIARELVHVLSLTVRGRRTAAVALLVLAALPFLYALGRWPLLEPDEARNAEVAREMLALGEWSVPHFNGLPYLDKPVLLFWMIAAAFRTLGTHELAARLPAAVAGWVTVVLTFAIGRRLFDRRSALLAAAIVASSPLVLAFGRLAIFDMPLTALVTTALWCLLQARAARHPAPWLLATGFAIGLATLTKGPVGLAVPLLVWIAARGALPPPPVRRGIAVLAATVAAGLVVAPWLVKVADAEPAFLRYALLDETLLRFSSVGRFHRGAPVYYYAGVIGWGLGAWAVVLAAVAPALWRRRRAGDAEAGAIGFLFRGALAILVFFTACASKRPAYILPAIVPLALLTAAGVNANPRRAAAALRGFGVVAAASGVAALVAAAGALIPAGRATAALSPSVVVTGGAFLIAWGVAAVAARRPALALAAGVVLAPGLCAVLVGPLAPFAETRSSRTMAAHVEPGAPVVCFRTFRTGLPFYLGHPVALASDRGSEMTSNYVVARPPSGTREIIVPETEFVAALARGERVYAVASTWSLARLTRLSSRRLVPVYADRHGVLLRAEG